MKYIFVGQNILGGMCLHALLQQSLKPMMVVTRPENDYPNLVVQLCSDYLIPIEMTANINLDQQVTHKIVSLAPDVIFCCSWGNLIREPLLSLPRLGWVNFHPSYLPKYRGPRPIEWQLINGESSGGCTAHFMVQEIDKGPIIFQERIRIDFNDNSETLRKKCGKLMGKLAIQSYHLLATQPYFQGVEQDIHNASYAPQRDDARKIDWHNRAVDIYNQIRGLSPYPCAIFLFNHREFLVADAAITTIPSNKELTGKIVFSQDDKIMIAASDFFVKISALRISDNIVDYNVKDLKSSLNQRG